MCRESLFVYVLQSVSNCAKRSIEQDGVIADDKRAILFKL